MSYCPDCKQDIRIGGPAHTCPESRQRTASGPSDAMTCSVLFIGGVADGQRRQDPGQPYCKVCADRPVMEIEYATALPPEIIREYAAYRRERIQAEREEWVIYVLDSLTTAQAMGKLIRGYSPQNVNVEPPSERKSQ